MGAPTNESKAETEIDPGIAENKIGEFQCNLKPYKPLCFHPSYFEKIINWNNLTNLYSRI